MGNHGRAPIKSAIIISNKQIDKKINWGVVAYTSHIIVGYIFK